MLLSLKLYAAVKVPILNPKIIYIKVPRDIRQYIKCQGKCTKIPGTFNEKDAHFACAYGNIDTLSLSHACFLEAETLVEYMLATKEYNEDQLNTLFCMSDWVNDIDIFIDIVKNKYKTVPALSEKALWKIVRKSKNRQNILEVLSVSRQKVSGEICAFSGLLQFEDFERCGYTGTENSFKIAIKEQNIEAIKKLNYFMTHSISKHVISANETNMEVFELLVEINKRFFTGTWPLIWSLKKRPILDFLLTNIKQEKDPFVVAVAVSHSLGLAKYLVDTYQWPINCWALVFAVQSRDPARVSYILSCYTEPFDLTLFGPRYNIEPEIKNILVRNHNFR